MEKKINKENLRLVMRFLKITNLWLTWLKYINNEKTERHWTDWNEVGKVFGHCSFTRYLQYEGVILQNGYPNIAETFRAYVKMVKKGEFEKAFHFAKTAFIKIS